MFHRTLQILILGENEPLQSVLADHEQDSLPDFTVTATQDPDPETLGKADIIICNVQDNFAEIRSLAKPEASIVAFLTAEAEQQLAPAEREQLDDIWQIPLSRESLRLRISHLFEEINGRDWGAFLMGCLDTFINSLQDMVWIKDLDGLHRKVNDYFCEFVGKPREEVEGSTHGEIWGVPEAEAELSCHESDQAAIDSGKTVIAEEVVETDGGRRLFRTIKTPIRDLEGGILGTVGIAHDMTNMLNLNMELALFIEMMPFPLMICDVEDRVAKANVRFLEFFETGMGQLLEVDWRDWYEENILHEISPTGEDIYRRFVHADGRVSFLKMISHEMNDLFGNYLGVIHVFEDVTTDKELEYNIWKLANTDALTGIANRQAFYENAKRIGSGEKISLFYVDLDNFKHVNDVYGHKAGDEALKLTAGILRDVFARDLPARLGGDEFIVCMRREASLPEIEAMAQELVDLMKEEFGANEKLSSISCSVGVAANVPMHDGIESLVKLADSAMYDAKKQGKGRYSVYRGDE